MKRSALCISILLIAFAPLHSQSEYSLDLTTDIVITAGAAGLLASLLLVPEAEETVADKLPGIDARLVFPYSETLDKIGTYAAYALLVAPALVTLGKLESVEIPLTYAGMYTEAFALTLLTKDLVKTLVYRERPYMYVDDLPPDEEDDYYNSFPSGHTSYAFMAATFLSSTYHREYPDSKWRYPITGIVYAASISLAVTRVISGNHFVTDVLAGAAIGAFYGWLIPKLHL